MGARYAVSMNSCTAAPWEVASLCPMESAQGMRSSPPYDLCSTDLMGGTPLLGGDAIFCDIDPQTGLIDPAGIETLITDKTRPSCQFTTGASPGI